MSRATSPCGGRTAPPTPTPVIRGAQTARAAATPALRGGQTAPVAPTPLGVS
jgi:hypothetical protein